MTKRAIFSETEKRTFSNIVQRYPIIEEKRKTADLEAKKRSAWTSIVAEYNADEDVQREELQLKVSGVAQRHF